MLGGYMRELKKVALYRCPVHGIGVRVRCDKCVQIKLPKLFSFGNDKDNPQ